MPGRQGNIYFFSLIIDLQFLRIPEITVLLGVSVKSEEKLALSVPASYAVTRGGGGDSHMKQTGMLVGNFEFNP